MMNLDVSLSELPMAATTTAAAVGAAAGAAAGPLLTWFAARRTARQPAESAVEDEQQLLAALLHQPSRRVTRLQAELDVDDDTFADLFVWPAHHHIAAALIDVVADVREHLELPPPDPTLTEQQIAEVAGPDTQPDWQAADAKVRRQLADQVRRRAQDGTFALQLDAPATFKQIVSDGRAGVAEPQFEQAAVVVYATYNDRELFNGPSQIVLADDPTAEQPLARRYTSPSARRHVAVAGVTAVMGGIAGWLVGTAAPLLLAAVGVLIAASVVVALVDHDTLYMDYWTLLPLTAASWGLVAADAQFRLGGDFSNLIAGGLIVVVVAVALEAVGLLYRLVRGQFGMGFGDTVMLVATCGVPAAISGSWQVGLWALNAGMILALLVAAAKAVVGRFDRNQPFPFAPYLAVGWPVGWLAFRLLM